MVANFIKPCIFKETTASGVPEAGYVFLYPKSDNGFYYRNSSQEINLLLGYDSFTVVSSSSSLWNRTFTAFSSQSANNSSVFSTVLANSAVNWNYQGTDIKALTSNWQNTFNTVQTFSATNWNSNGIFLPLSGGTVTGNLSVVNSLSSNNLKTQYIDLIPKTSETYSDGRVYYDSVERTLVFFNDDSTLSYPINKMMWTIGVNKTGTTVPKGTVVYLSGAQGNRGQMWPAQATADYRSADTIGVTMHSTGINQEGYIMTIGELHGIDTRGYPEGATLYLSPTASGGITHIKPISPYHMVKVGFSLNSTVNGKIYVEIDNGYELDELHNVKIENIQNEQGLVYNSTSSSWINQELYNGSDVKSLSSNWQKVYDLSNIFVINSFWG